MQFGRIFAVMQSKKGQMEAKIVHNQINLHFVLFNTRRYLDILLRRGSSPLMT